MTKGQFEDEEGSAGRMGRFRRKFTEINDGGLDWIFEETVSEDLTGSSQLMSRDEEIKKSKAGKGKKK